MQSPGRVGSKYLLNRLLNCGVCGKPYSAQGAESGKLAYCICGTLFGKGAGMCSAGYLNAQKLETFVVAMTSERIQNEEAIVALVQPVAEEIGAMAGELSDMRKRLEKLYEAFELTPCEKVVAPHHLSEAP